jgi:hypothetical protein
MGGGGVGDASILSGMGIGRLVLEEEEGRRDLVYDFSGCAVYNCDGTGRIAE